MRLWIRCIQLLDFLVSGMFYAFLPQCEVLRYRRGEEQWHNSRHHSFVFWFFLDGKDLLGRGVEVNSRESMHRKYISMELLWDYQLVDFILIIHSCARHHS